VNTRDLLKKMESRRPKLAEHIDRWALPEERLFPLDTVEMLKMAANAFEHQAESMTPPQRLVCARNICGRAQELDVDIIPSLAYKYASSSLSAHFPSSLSLRKQATAHLADADLDKLLEVASIINTKPDIKDRVTGLDKVAWALEDFDRRHDLVGHWGHWFPDPAYSTYGLTADPGQRVERVSKVAGYTVCSGDFDGADWSRVEGKVEANVIEGLRTASDKLAVFDSLPTPEKELIYQSLFTE
jgi:hypothetical protein